MPLGLQITHRDSRRSEKKKKCTRNLERKRLLMGHYKFMSRDNSLKTACVSLTFLELVQKKTFHTLNCGPSSRRIVVTLGHSIFLLPNKRFIYFWKGNLLVFVLVKFGIRTSTQCTAAFVGFRRYAPAFALTQPFVVCNRLLNNCVLSLLIAKADRRGRRLRKEGKHMDHS